MKEVSNLKTAIVYAQALYGGAQEVGDLLQVYENARSLREIILQNKEDFSALDNPLWNINDKKNIVSELSEKLTLSQSLANLLKLLLENRKFSLLSEVLSQYIKIYQDKHNIAEVDVKTVTALTKSQDLLLKQKLSDIFLKDVIINYHIDPQIIGGLIIKYGTNFIDNSICNKLKLLEQLMKGEK